MDSSDIRILQIIEKNSRIKEDELAVLLGMETEDVKQRICRMEDEGIICGFHTIINWDRTDIEQVTALIEVRVTPQRGKGFDDIAERGAGFDAVAERIYKYPEVESVYLMSGGFDLMVILEGKTLKEVALFVSEKLSTLDQVIETQSHFILKKYKDHGTSMARKEPDRREPVSF